MNRDKAGGGDLRAASAYYLQAVRLASALPLPAELRAEVARGRRRRATASPRSSSRGCASASGPKAWTRLWRPEITETERRLISTLFEAVDAQGGGRVAWSV